MFLFYTEVLVMWMSTTEGCNEQGVRVCMMNFGLPNDKGIYICKYGHLFSNNERHRKYVQDKFNRHTLPYTDIPAG